MGVREILGIGGVVKEVGEAIDRNVTSEEERLKLKNELERIVGGELTARHTADMQSDSWMSKNVRPITVISLLVLFLFFATADAFGWMTVNESYLSMLNDLMLTSIAFYFGSRGVEKTVKTLRR